MQKLYILDTETTGLEGYPNDKVLELAIISLDLENYTYKIECNELIGHNTDNWNDELKNCWIFNNSDITLDMIQDATPYSVHEMRVKHILEGKYVTSFNRDYDIGKFLCKPPYNFLANIEYFPCIMLESTEVCKIPGYHGDYKWPRLEEAHRILIENPKTRKEIHKKMKNKAYKMNFENNNIQDHRALSDTIMVAEIVFELVKRGHFKHYLDKMKNNNIT